MKIEEQIDPNDWELMKILKNEDLKLIWKANDETIAVFKRVK